MSQSLAMQVMSGLSAAASGLIVLSYMIFPKMRGKIYFEIQVYVAISNVLTSLGSAVGVVPTGSFACWFQGIVTNVFTLTSLTWTIVISFLLYWIIQRGKQFSLDYRIHLLCWLLPVLVTVLPMTNATYGKFVA